MGFSSQGWNSCGAHTDSCSVCASSLHLCSVHPTAEGNSSAALQGLTAPENKSCCSSLHLCSWESYLKKVFVCREGGDGAEAFQGREAPDQISFWAFWHFFLEVLSRGVTHCAWDFARWVCTFPTTLLYFQLLNLNIKDKKNPFLKFPNSIERLTSEIF